MQGKECRGSVQGAKCKATSAGRREGGVSVAPQRLHGRLTFLALVALRPARIIYIAAPAAPTCEPGGEDGGWGEMGEDRHCKQARAAGGQASEGSQVYVSAM